jgi:hypothetical protein
MSSRRHALVLIACIVLVVPALGAKNSFNGRYVGKQVLIKGEKSCPTEENVSVTIKGDDLSFTDSSAKTYMIGFDPDPGGSFSVLDADIGGIEVDIQGRVNGKTLDADLTSDHCQHHWHLEKRG